MTRWCAVYTCDTLSYMARSSSSQFRWSGHVCVQINYWNVTNGNRWFAANCLMNWVGCHCACDGNDVWCLWLVGCVANFQWFFGIWLNDKQMRDNWKSWKVLSASIWIWIFNVSDLIHFNTFSAVNLKLWIPREKTNVCRWFLKYDHKYISVFFLIFVHVALT